VAGPLSVPRPSVNCTRLFPLCSAVSQAAPPARFFVILIGFGMSEIEQPQRCREHQAGRTVSSLGRSWLARHKLGEYDCDQTEPTRPTRRTNGTWTDRSGTIQPRLGEAPPDRRGLPPGGIADVRYGGIDTMGQVMGRDALIEERKRLRREGKRVVFTNGCFDLLHAGHVRYLREARSLGDLLVVALNSDASVRLLKGEGRPILNQDERAEIMAALQVVDYVTIFDEATPRELIARLLPDVLVKGGDWAIEAIVGGEEVEAAGGRVLSLPYLQGSSTSEIVERIRKRDA
jgi:rfaE bifunctional protein nucleotidyltransferase chain/domain